MLELLDASTSTVVYEAATSLTALTSNPVAVKAAAGKLIELAIREADNNVKLICLERVDQLRIRNEGVLDDLTMEALRVLSSPDIDVRRKASTLPWRWSLARTWKKSSCCSRKNLPRPSTNNMNR